MAETTAAAMLAGLSANAIRIRVIETQSFTRAAKKLLTDEEKIDLRQHVAQLRELGTIIPGTGGLRKLRWAQDNKGGKRGGNRVIYYYMEDNLPLYLLALYPKSRQENMTQPERKAARKFVETLKKEIKDSIKKRVQLRLVEGHITTVKVLR